MLETDFSDLKKSIDNLEESVDNIKKQNDYSDLELYSIGDSLFASGVWQNEVAKRLGIKFDQNKNADPSFPLSIGGTSSDMSRIGTTYFRTLNLIKKGYIQDKGEKSVIILENVNDGYLILMWQLHPLKWIRATLSMNCLHRI